VWSTQSTPDVPEQRRLSRTVYLTEGYDIRQLESPRKLVEVVLHAMLGSYCDFYYAPHLIDVFPYAGHWVLFKEGWLHRDVSVSNIMRITPEPRAPVEE
jgi:hypothetical protein